MLDVPVSTIRERGRNGTLPRVKLGCQVRVIREHIVEAILAAERTRRALVASPAPERRNVASPERSDSHGRVPQPVPVSTRP
jgi:Iap family predicted aminopeptidase